MILFTFALSGNGLSVDMKYLDHMFFDSKHKAKERRNTTIQKLDALGVDHCEGLPLIGGYKLCKSEKEICKRFIASLFFSALATEYMQSRADFDESKEVTERAVEAFRLKDALLPDEKKMLEACDESTAIKESWAVECCCMLAWALGLLPDSDVEIPDTEGAYDLFRFIEPYDTLDAFMASCKLRGIEEIMDMLDLYYNYHWACVDHRLNLTTRCGTLNEEVVMERRKALEWLVCTDKDWNEISLDT